MEGNNRNKIMKLLAFFPLQGPYQKSYNKSYFSWRKILETAIFLDLFNERRFHLLLKFLNSVDNKRSQCRKTRYNCENCKVTPCAAPFPMLPYGG
jgi:hypothetical protein